MKDSSFRVRKKVRKSWSVDVFWEEFAEKQIHLYKRNLKMKSLSIVSVKFLRGLYSIEFNAFFNREY